MQNGDIYEGEYVSGVPEGYGTFITEGKIKWQGEWKAGRLHGQVIVDKDT